MNESIISKTRFRIEQYFGTVKVNAEMTLKAMCASLLKAVNKLEFA